MRVVHTPLFPTGPEEGVLALLSIAATADGDVVVGYDVRQLQSKRPLALGCAPPTTRQDLGDDATEALSALLDAVASLLDWPPFDG